MDAINLLKDDHRAISTWFDTYWATGGVRRKEEIVIRLVEALCVHMALEEELVYRPAHSMSPAMCAQVNKGFEEHQLIKSLLVDLQRVLEGHPDGGCRELRLDAAVKLLMDRVRSRVEQEHEVLYPELERRLTPAELEALARTLTEAKISARREGNPVSSATAQAVKAGRALQTPAERAVRR